MGVSMSPKHLFIFHKFDVTRVEFLQLVSKGYLGAPGVKGSSHIVKFQYQHFAKQRRPMNRALKTDLL